MTNVRRQYLDDAIRMIKEELGMEQPPYEEKSIYLKKENDVIGLHAVGDATETGWQQYEGWCNAYGNDWKFLGSIYRIFGPIEDEAAALKAEGWVEIKKPEGT